MSEFQRDAMPDGVGIPIVFRLNDEYEVNAFEYPDGTIIGAGIARLITSEVTP